MHSGRNCNVNVGCKSTRSVSCNIWQPVLKLAIEIYWSVSWSLHLLNLQLMTMPSQSRRVWSRLEVVWELLNRTIPVCLVSWPASPPLSPKSWWAKRGRLIYIYEQSAIDGCNFQTRLDEVNASLAEGGENPLRLSQDVAEIREGVGEVSSSSTSFLPFLILILSVILITMKSDSNDGIIKYHLRLQNSWK